MISTLLVNQMLKAINKGLRYIDNTTKTFFTVESLCQMFSLLILALGGCWCYSCKLSKQTCWAFCPLGTFSFLLFYHFGRVLTKSLERQNVSVLATSFYYRNLSVESILLLRHFQPSSEFSKTVRNIWARFTTAPCAYLLNVIIRHNLLITIYLLTWLVVCYCKHIQKVYQVYILLTHLSYRIKYMSLFLFIFNSDQRVTGVCVFILTGLSVLMSPILKVRMFVSHSAVLLFRNLISGDCVYKCVYIVNCSHRNDATSHSQNNARNPEHWYYLSTMLLFITWQFSDCRPSSKLC